MERRVERFVRKVIEKKGELLVRRPKQAARLAGKTEQKPTYKKDPSEIDERVHLKEHDELFYLDSEPTIPTLFTDIELGDVHPEQLTLASRFSGDHLKRTLAAVEEADELDGDYKDIDIEWSANHADSDIQELPLEDLRGRKSALTREERDFSRQPRHEDLND